MISREDAKNEVVRKSWFDDGNILNLTEDIEKHIDEIYDSIGSCSECKHFSVIEPENFLNCSELGCEVPSIKHFCADFERK